MRLIRYAVSMFAGVVLVVSNWNYAAADLSKLLGEKKEVSALDFTLMRAETDIRAGITLHKERPWLDKWRVMPALQSMLYRDKAIEVRYDLTGKDFPHFSSGEKDNEFSKLTAFTMATLQPLIPSLERKDLRIIFNFNGQEAGRLENDEIKIGGELNAGFSNPPETGSAMGASGY